MDKSLDLTAAEWRSLGQLMIDTRGEQIPSDHRSKLIRLGVAAEKAGRTVVTFAGRLVLRERREESNSSRSSI
jgi:hypothetical protein